MTEIKAIIAALQFLTRLPFQWINLEAGDFGKGLTYFPLVGLLIGGISGAAYLYLMFLPDGVSAALVLLLHVALTGGLHWDGLMDTIDGIFSARNRQRMLEIMKDSRVGAHGVTGAILLFLLKFVLLLSLSGLISGTSLVFLLAVTSMLARWNIAIVMMKFPYARKAGLGTFFREKGSKRQLLVASIFAVSLSYLLLSLQGLWLMAGSLLLMYFFAKKLTNVLGGLTGDTYGALCELEEIWLLLLATVMLSL